MHTYPMNNNHHTPLSFFSYGKHISQRKYLEYLNLLTNFSSQHIYASLDIRAILVAGTGFFLDSYSIFAINLITTFLGLVFWPSPTSAGSLAAAGGGGQENYGGVLPAPVNTALKSSTSAGIIIGQVVFGWLADVFGRRRMYGIELGVIVVATLGCALTGQSVGLGKGSTGVLVFWRVMMVSWTLFFFPDVER